MAESGSSLSRTRGVDGIERQHFKRCLFKFDGYRVLAATGTPELRLRQGSDATTWFSAIVIGARARAKWMTKAFASKPKKDQ